MRLNLALIVGFTVVASSAQGSVALLMDLDDLVEQSPVILIGEVSAQQSLWDEERQTIYTVTEVDVERYLKADVQSPVAVLKHLGGKVGDLEGRLLGGPELQVGQRVLLFLERRSDGLLRIIGHSQGQYVVRDAPAGPTAHQFVPSHGLTLAVTDETKQPPPTGIPLPEMIDRIVELLEEVSR